MGKEKHKAKSHISHEKIKKCMSIMAMYKRLGISITNISLRNTILVKETGANEDFLGHIVLAYPKL